VDQAADGAGRPAWTRRCASTPQAGSGRFEEPGPTATTRRRTDRSRPWSYVLIGGSPWWLLAGDHAPRKQVERSFDRDRRRGWCRGCAPAVAGGRIFGPASGGAQPGLRSARSAHRDRAVFRVDWELSCSSEGRDRQRSSTRVSLSTSRHVDQGLDRNGSGGAVHVGRVPGPRSSGKLGGSIVRKGAAPPYRAAGRFGRLVNTGLQGGRKIAASMFRRLPALR